MAEFLNIINQSPVSPEIPWAVILARLVTAFVLGGAVALLYWITHRRDETLVWSFIATLVLLSILIAMVTQVIGDNVARAFSLVGALSIVRFRTVVEDTRDTAFVIFAVIVGMAIGAGHTEVALAGFCVVVPAAALLRSRRPAFANGVARFWNLTVRVNSELPSETVLDPIFRVHFADIRLLSVATCKQGTAIELIYRVRLRPSSIPTTILSDLNGMAEITGVELKAF